MSRLNLATILKSFPSRSNLLLVALTGGIAAGKSTVAAFLEQKGCIIFRADEVAHELMLPGQPGWKKIVKHFGQNVLQSEGKIDRQKLGRIIFTDAAAREFVNRCIHPLVLKEQVRRIDEIKKQSPGSIFICEAALVIEAGYQKFYDKIIVVTCRTDLQIKRIINRYQITEDEALARIKTQLPDEEKVKKADYVIDTSGIMSETVEQVEKVFACLSADALLKSFSRLKN